MYYMNKTNNEALVSIITPSYNSAKYISETINSVLNQSYSSWEMIIVDDCSTDNTIEVIKKFMFDHKNISLFENTINEGAAVSRNKAIKKAKGKYIAFLDSDDLWKKDKLEKQIKFMQDNNVDLSYSSFDLIDEEGRNLNKSKNPPDTLDYIELLKENQIGCLSAIYNQDNLGKYYMPLIRKRQDYGLWLSILKKTKAYKVAENLAIYRVRTNSVSSNKIEMLKYNYQLFRDHENMSVIRAAYYVCWNIFRKIKNRGK